MTKFTEITVHVRDIPKVKRLHSAVHAVLLARLLSGTVPIDTWNELIDAHDDMCPTDDDD